MTEFTKNDERLALENTLFLALRRPSMFLGCPVEGVLWNMTGSIIAGGWIGMGSWRILAWAAVFMVAVHFTMRIGISRDYNYFRLKSIWMQTKGRSTNKEFWGGSTTALLPSQWPSRSRWGRYTKLADFSISEGPADV